MPGPVLPPSPVGTFPKSLSTKFVVSRKFEVRSTEYHDGTTERASLVDASRRTWKMARHLTASEASTLRAWFDDHQGDAFYFYDLRETSPVNTYDATGAATAGRYIVRFNSDFREIIGWPRTDIDVELIEVGNETDVLGYIGDPITPLTVVQVAKASSVLTLPGGDLGPGTVGLISVSSEFTDPVTAGNAVIVAVAGRVLYPGTNITGGPRPGVSGTTSGGTLGARTARVGISFNVGTAETSIGGEATVSIAAGHLLTMTRPNPTLGTIPGADSWNIYINGKPAQAGIAETDSYTEPSGGAGVGGTSTPNGNPILAGFNFRELIWANGGVGGSQFGGEAMGLYVARDIPAGTLLHPGSVTFIATGLNGNPLLDNDADLCIIAVEVGPIPAITNSLGGFVQQGNSTSDLAVSLTSGGYGLKTDFGSHTEDAAAFADIQTAAGHHFAALLSGDYIPTTPATPTISRGSTPYTFIDSVTSANGLPLYLWLI